MRFNHISSANIVILSVISWDLKLRLAVLTAPNFPFAGSQQLWHEQGLSHDLIRSDSAEAVLPPLSAFAWFRFGGTRRALGRSPAVGSMKIPWGLKGTQASSAIFNHADSIFKRPGKFKLNHSHEVSTWPNPGQLLDPSWRARSGVCWAVRASFLVLSCPDYLSGQGFFTQRTWFCLLEPLGRLLFYFALFWCILVFSVLSVLVNSFMILPNPFAAWGIVNIGGLTLEKTQVAQRCTTLHRKTKAW